MDATMRIETVDMHTGGEPVRIIVSGLPELKGETILEKINYMKSHLDNYRKLIMNEPRGHKDMYGAVLIPKDGSIDVIFIHNEGYSTMCGHAVIALGRYVVDRHLINQSSPETEVVFNCPCGPVKARVQCNNQSSGSVTFQSVPAFVYKIEADIKIPDFGVVKVDIAFGGAFYAIIKDKDIGLNIQTTSISEMVKMAALVTECVKKQLPINHPEEDDLSFLYGTIVTDGNDTFEDGPSTNICIFADKQVDRSPTGSGVTARIALLLKKKLISLNQSKEFKSIIGTSFTGKAVSETLFHQYDAVVVEVTGIAYYTGEHTFYLERKDPLTVGFQLER